MTLLRRGLAKAGLRWPAVTCQGGDGLFSLLEDSTSNATYCSHTMCRVNSCPKGFCGYNSGMSKKTAKPRMGRPPKVPDERKDSVLRIRLTHSERSKLGEVAGVGDLSSWARGVLLEAAERAAKRE